jgi:nitroreductase
MNPVLGNIFARRSVRVYQEKRVDDQLVHDLLEAAMAAPSAVAKDPWDFLIVRDHDLRRRMVDRLPNGKMLVDAALGIVVCGDLERAHDRQLSYLLQDCSAAIENMLLAASMLGLGACWLGVHPREDRVAHLRGLLQLPESVIPVGIVSLGWPAESPPPRTRYRAAAVHREVW